MARKFGKKNHVKIDPFNYSLMLLGEPKVGKTSMLYEVADKLVGEDGYIFAELYREHGADAIEGIVAEDVSDWETWVEFVDDIVYNKTTDYKDLRVVFLDTYDQYILMAEKEALDMWNRKNPDKRVDSLNAAWNGYGAGGKKAIELMFEQTDRLEEVGVKVWWIGHCKTKEVKNIYNDDTYQILTSDQQQNYFNALKKNLHFLCLAYFDRELQKEKTGKKTVNTITEETRKIKFRDDSFVVDSGSRFKDIVPEINLDSDEFINAINNAIRAEVEGKGGSVEKRKEENAKEDAENLKQIAKREEEMRVQREAEQEAAELENVVAEIVDFIKQNIGDNKPAVEPVMDECRKRGYDNPTKITSLDDAKAILATTLK